MLRRNFLTALSVTAASILPRTIFGRGSATATKALTTVSETVLPSPTVMPSVPEKLVDVVPLPGTEMLDNSPLELAREFVQRIERQGKFPLCPPDNHVRYLYDPFDKIMYPMSYMILNPQKFRLSYELVANGIHVVQDTAQGGTRGSYWEVLDFPVVISPEDFAKVKGIGMPWVRMLSYLRDPITGKVWSRNDIMEHVWDFTQAQQPELAGRLLSVSPNMEIRGLNEETGNWEVWTPFQIPHKLHTEFAGSVGPIHAGNTWESFVEVRKVVNGDAACAIASFRRLGKHFKYQGKEYMFTVPHATRPSDHWSEYDWSAQKPAGVHPHPDYLQTLLERAKAR